MGKKRTYTVTEVNREPSLFQTAVECENCGENTQNILEFQDKELRWQKINLCDKCAEELL